MAPWAWECEILHLSQSTTRGAISVLFLTGAGENRWGEDWAADQLGEVMQSRKMNVAQSSDASLEILYENVFPFHSSFILY